MKMLKLDSIPPRGVSAIKIWEIQQAAQQQHLGNRQDGRQQNQTHA
jgi:hypothetical protein